MALNSIMYLLFVISVCSCGNKDTLMDVTNPFLEVNTSTLNFGEEYSEKVVEIKCNTKWTCEVEGENSSWCHLDPRNGELVISVDNNEDKDIRQARVIVTASQMKKTIEVVQLGWGKAILLTTNSATIPVTGGKVELEVTTNIEYQYKLPQDCEWVHDTQTRAADHPLVSKVFVFHVDASKTDGERQAVITFSDVDLESDLKPATFTIVQKGLGQYDPLNPEELEEDILVKVTGATASSEQPGYGIANSYDGNKETQYHSSWNNSDDHYYPIILEYTFAEGTDMDYMIYYPRADGHWNGHFKLVDIEVRSNANTRGVDEWQYVMTYDFGGTSSARRVDFPHSLIGVSALRFTIHSGSGDGQGFAVCSEMEFYKKNPESFEYTTLFTDPSCSELKTGITEKNILSCTHSFFKNIAYYMYHGRYKTDFRINTFQAYPHPDVQALENKTSPYSLLDNPTGIALESGETLVAMVGDLQGQQISLRVQNLNKPGGDGFGGMEYPLSTGINKLKIEQGGLAYIMYHTPDFEDAPKIKMHFATGKVNGYFDSQDPEHEGRWKELLNQACDDYFDVLGKYAHLTFPTNRFRNHTTDLKALIDTYDLLVYGEQQLMGLEKYGRMFRNRMYFNVMYHSYMYATSYHTAYHDETLSELCNEKSLKTTACWGPAHEVGHCNQTRPGLKWVGTTEVTNNIFSEYVQTTLFGQPSRIQTESMGSQESPNRYSWAWNSILVGKISHALEPDVFCKLIPFWQLELYFGKVLGMTPLQQTDRGGFYPDVFEYIRTHEDLKTPGEQQLEFVYIASKVAHTNLLDFFEKWGFLTPVDVLVEDYGSGQMTITQDQADEIRRRVEALGYSKPDIALEYITDNTVDVFKNKKDIVVGTASRTEASLTMKNWKNVVVYEVRDGNEGGTLICVSDGMLEPSATASFSVKGGWKDTYKVYAVSYNNKRIEVKFL